MGDRLSRVTNTQQSDACVVGSQVPDNKRLDEIVPAHNANCLAQSINNGCISLHNVASLLESKIASDSTPAAQIRASKFASPTVDPKSPLPSNPYWIILLLQFRVSVRLLSGPVLQPVRDGPHNLADRVPMPAHLKALGYRAHNISSQAHASLGVVGLGGCRASVSINGKRAQLVTHTCRDACEK